MAHLNINQIRVKRGNTLTISSYTGPSGELVLNTQTNQLVSQDGITAGGHLVTGDFSGIEANLTILQTEVANIAGITGNVTQLESYFANVNLEEITASISTIQTELSANGSATIGNLTTNLITFPYGNIASDVVGPGLTLLANVDAGQEFLGMFIGNTTNQEQGHIYVEQNNAGIAVTNLTTNQSYDWSFNQDGSMSLAGNLSFGDNSLQTTAYRGPAGQTSFATTGYVDTANSYVQTYTTNAISTAVNNLINSAPGTLDTLGQIAANLATEAGAIGSIVSSITSVNANVTSANSKIATLQTQVYTNANTGAYLSTYLPTYTGNLTAGNLTVSGNINYVGNVNIGGNLYAGNNTWVFDNTGILTINANGQNIYGGTTIIDTVTQSYLALDGENGTGFYTGSGDGVAASGNTVWITTGGGNSQVQIDQYGSFNLQYGSNINLTNGSINSANKITASSDIKTTGGNFWANLGNVSAKYINATNSFHDTAVGTNAIYSANIIAGNILAGGYFFANGTPFTSSSYGNTQVAAYLVANPQSGTYSNTNVSAYLTTATITTTGNITAGNLITSGTYTVANITTTGAYGNITGANVISANTLQVSNGIFWANGVAWSSGGGTTYSNTNVAAYLTTQTFYSNSNVASYLVANPQAGTYSNVNTAAYIAATTFSAISSSVLNSVGQINGTAIYIQTNGSHNFYFDSTGNLVLPTGGAINYANGQSILSGISTGSGTYSNANVVANLQNYVTSISTTANITTTANIIAPNYLFANGVNILSTIAPSSTYSNTNVSAYLTTQTFYSNANVVANLQNLTTNVVTTANVQATYFVGNGSSLTGLTYNQAGNIYGSSSNVTLQAGSYNWTFDNTGNLTIPTNSNIVYANGTVFSSGTGSSGGTNYTNANVIAMLSANTAVFVGNIGNLNIGNLQANTTSLFLGANTVISNYGSPTFGYASHIGNNIYFDANSVQRYRNTQTGASDLIVGPGALYWYASSSAVTANAATGWTGATGAYMAISTSGMSLYNGAGITSSGAITIQNATGLVTNQATTGLFQNASTINAATPSGILSVGQSAYSAGYIGNVTIGAGTVQTGALPLTVRASGTYNIIILSGIAGGYNSPPYNNQSVTGGSGTGMTASYSSVGGYVNQASIVVTNPGTGYKNGDIVTLPGGGGSTAQIYNYNPNISNGTTVGTANYVFGIDGNLTLPGNVLYATNSAIYGDFTNSTVNYRTIFRPLAANSNPGVYTAPSGTGTAASWQAANSSNIANASKILIATNGTTDVQLVSGINGTGTYLPMSFYTNGSNQMQLGTGGNLLMVTGGNIATSGNVIAGNIIANQYGNSIGTTATYSGNITASSVIASGSSGPQTRFLWDTWQANSTSALSSFTPSGTIGGNAAWDSTQAYGLKLTTNTTSQSGYINWNSSTINYNYDMVITASIAASGGTGADGQWIYFGSNAAITGNPGNTNTYGGIAVMNHYYSSASQFEVYVGGTQTNIPFIGNGNYVTSGVTLWNASYTSFYNLTLKIRKIQNGNRMLEVYLNEIYQGSVNIGNWTPVGNYFGVAAYTGGSTAQNWVRQLRIDW